MNISDPAGSTDIIASPTGVAVCSIKGIPVWVIPKNPTITNIGRNIKTLVKGLFKKSKYFTYEANPES